MNRLLMMLCSFSLLFSAAACAHADVQLTRKGKPAAVILLPEKPTDIETLAATELQEHIQKISGASLLIENASSVEKANVPANLNVIVLGSLAPKPAITSTAPKALTTDPSAFTLSVKGKRIDIAGVGDQGTLIGVYELLEQLGVRWYHPGELGTVIPSKDTLAITDQQTAQVPSFAARYAAPADTTWQRRNRMAGTYFVAAHGVPGLKGSKAQMEKLLEQYPECYALNATTGKRHVGQICVSNPKTLELVNEAIRQIMQKNPAQALIGMGPNDGAGFCECDNCKALDGGDWDAFSNEPSHTDRYWWFYNRIIETVGQEYPDFQIQTYIYHSYIRPPVKVKPNPRVNGALAPITYCRIHGQNNPICPETNYYAYLAKEWGKLIPRLYDRGYWFNLADPGLPFPMMHRLRAQIPFAHEMGIYGWRVEVIGHWASENPSLWVAGKLMWNHEADVDALVADFATHYYGPAAKPMLQYHTLLDNTLRDSDHHTGSSFDMPHHYPKSIRDQAARLLNQAAKLAGHGDSAYARRVALTQKSFNYLQAFVDMIESRNRFDFAASQKALGEADAILKDLIEGYDVPMLARKGGPNYLRRFFRMPTEQAYKRVTEGNEMVAPLQDEWQFMLDQNAGGESIGFHLPLVKGGNWMTLKTASSSWSNQGLRYYKGEAWYRQTVDVPARFQGKRVFLWFGGVDEKAKVFVNGKEVGISPGSAFVPFEVDATEAIVPGKPNLVAVRVSNIRVNELGTGGLTAPAFFYAPQAGKDAQLENIRILGRTFP